MTQLMSLNHGLSTAPVFNIEVLTAAELDAIVGGGPFENGNSATTSQCDIDGNNEPGST